MSEQYYCVQDPQGVLVHTTVALSEQGAIEEWLQQEGATLFIVNVGRSARGESPVCCQSWEGFESQGYKVIPITITPNAKHVN